MKPQVCASGRGCVQPSPRCPGSRAAPLRQRLGAGGAVPQTPASIPPFLSLLPNAGALPDPHSAPERCSQSCPSLLQPRAPLCWFPAWRWLRCLVGAASSAPRSGDLCHPRSQPALAAAANFSSDLDSLFFHRFFLGLSFLVGFFPPRPVPLYAVKPLAWSSLVSWGEPVTLLKDAAVSKEERKRSGAAASAALVKGKRDELVDPSSVIRRHVSRTQLQYLLCKEKYPFSDSAHVGQASHRRST